MKYAGIIIDDVQNGSGYGAVYFSQGCSHHCKGCQNPETWDFNDGKEFNEEILDKLFKFYENTSFATRLTLSGGDPIDTYEQSAYIARKFKNKFPKHKIWLYTGYNFDDIKDKKELRELFSLIDVIVDGEFKQELRDITLQFRGSSNQRIIDVKKSLNQNKIILFGE